RLEGAIVPAEASAATDKPDRSRLSFALRRDSMRSHANHHRPFAILSALGSAAVLALAFVTQVGAKESAIPFSGSFSGTVAFTSPTTAAFEGSGLATLTGR